MIFLFISITILLLTTSLIFFMMMMKIRWMREAQSSITCSTFYLQREDWRESIIWSNVWPKGSHKAMGRTLLDFFFLLQMPTSIHLQHRVLYHTARSLNDILLYTFLSLSLNPPLSLSLYPHFTKDFSSFLSPSTRPSRGRTAVLKGVKLRPQLTVCSDD